MLVNPEEWTEPIQLQQPLIGLLLSHTGSVGKRHQSGGRLQATRPGAFCYVVNLGGPWRSLGGGVWAGPCRVPGLSEHGASPPLLSDPATRVDIHLKHLHDPLIATGAINELGQRQLACARVGERGMRQRRGT